MKLAPIYPFRALAVMVTLVAVAGLIAGLRVVGFTGQTFQAAAHMYTAGLAVAAWYEKPEGDWCYLLWALFGLLCVCETLCFFHSKGVF